MISIEQNLSWIVPVAIGSLVALTSFIAICTYCFKKKSDEDDEEDGDGLTKNEKYGIKKGQSKQFSYMQVPKYQESTEQASRSSGKRTSGDETSWSSERFIAISPNITPPLKEVTVQPPTREIKSILKPKSNDGDQGKPAQNLMDMSTEPEPPLQTNDLGEDLGTLFFTLAFRDDKLIMTIKKATGLPAKDFTGTSDPFVKVCLLPDKKHKLETRVKRKTLNPKWNEIFIFEGTLIEKLSQKRLYMQVLDYDRFSRNDPIGEIELALGDLHLHEEDVLFEKKLLPCKRDPSYLGDLLIAMQYFPTQNRITIGIRKCVKLKVMDITGGCDPYVKIYLVYAGKRIDKKKTSVQRRTLSPIWNEEFEFDVPIDKLRDITFVFTVMDYDRILTNEAIGQVIIGYRTAGTSLKHWTDMMNQPRTKIYMWHKIIKY
eukprot:gene12646-13945_t